MTTEIVLVWLVIFIASVLQGVFGFAFMLFAMPLVSLVLNIKTAAPLLSLLAFSVAAINLHFALRLSGSLDYRKILPLLIGAPFGVPLGIFFVVRFEVTLIKLVLGAVLILYSVYSLANTKKFFRLPGWSGYLAGFLSGTLGGAFNIGGPPVVFYIASRDWMKADTISSLALFFIVNSTIVILSHVAVGHITNDIFATFLKILPAEIAGMAVGAGVLRRMSEEKYKKSLFVLLMMIGILLLV